MALQFSNRNEQILLAFTITVSGAIALPLVLNHLSHVDGLLHMSIHAGGFIIASFLTTMALISWKRTKIPRMMISSFAFGVLALAQVVYMYLERNDHNHFTFENEIFDILIVAVTVLFAVGVFYKR